MTHTIAACTVKNSWWWTEELSETCRVLLQKYIREISASSWCYYNNYHDVRSPERQIRGYVLSLRVNMKTTATVRSQCRWTIPALWLHRTIYGISKRRKKFKLQTDHFLFTRTVLQYAVSALLEQSLHCTASVWVPFMNSFPYPTLARVLLW